MTIREKETIEIIVTNVKDLQQYRNKEEIVSYLDYNIYMRKNLGHTNDFMENLYFLRHYYNDGNQLV